MYKPTAQKEIPAEVNKFYWLQVHCSNCGLNSSLAFRRGDLVEETACPDCECLTLKK